MGVHNGRRSLSFILTSEEVGVYIYYLSILPLIGQCHQPPSIMDIMCWSSACAFNVNMNRVD
jgi:hypothetical protein